MSVVNALSDWLKLKIWREGKVHEMEFRQGVPVAPLKVTGETRNRRGTEVHFLASVETFQLLNTTSKFSPSVFANCRSSITASRSS